MSAALGANAPLSPMSAAVAAGFPAAAVIPLVPALNSPATEKRFDAADLGKAPAGIGDDGYWYRLKDWQHGCNDSAWGKAAEAGANAGLRLGVDVYGRDQTYVFVDVDPCVGLTDDSPETKMAAGFSKRVVEGLRRVLGQPLWIRRTRLGRAGVLLRIARGGEAGAKAVYHFNHKDFVKPFKIEYLATGQQVGFGGRHLSGRVIEWYHSDSGQVQSFPPAADIPAVSGSAAVHAALRAVCDDLRGLGIEVVEGKDRVAVDHADGGADPAPSTELLVELLDALPHGPDTSYDDYVATMLAVSGCVRAAGLTGVDLTRVVTAAVNWAAGWEDPKGKGTDWVSEYNRWDTNFSRQSVSVGWGRLLRAAAAGGRDDFRIRSAQFEFAAAGLVPEVKPAALVAAEAEAARVRAPTPVDVYIQSDLAETAREIATIMASTRKIFDFGERRCRIDITGGRASVRAMTADDVPHAAAPVCRVVSRNKNGDVVAVTMPKDVRSLVLSAPGYQCGVPVLNGIAAAPVLAEDGEIKTTMGYDAASGLYTLPLPALTIPERPTTENAQAALAMLRSAIRTFPFADAETGVDPEIGVPVVDVTKPPAMAESAALTAVMTAVCRPSLTLAPGLMVTAPAGSGSGAGKGLLVRTIAAIAFGQAPRAFNAGPKSDELDKRIGAELMCADAVMLLDNVNATALRSDTLASALTESPARIRILGASTMVTLSSKTFITVTGNGLAPSEDLVRRFVTCSLDAKVENPSARPFRDGENEFLAAIRHRRGELLSAALTIWRWGRQQEQLTRGEPLGSFETWARWCRDPLLSLGCQDPVSQIADARATDPYRMRIESAFLQWWQFHGDAAVRAIEIDDGVSAIIDPNGRTRQSRVAALSRHKGCRCGGFVLEAVPEDSKAGKRGTAYRLRWEGEGEAPARERVSADIIPLKLIDGGKR